MVQMLNSLGYGRSHPVQLVQRTETNLYLFEKFKVSLETTEMTSDEMNGYSPFLEVCIFSCGKQLRMSRCPKVHHKRIIQCECHSVVSLSSVTELSHSVRLFMVTQATSLRSSTIQSLSPDSIEPLSIQSVSSIIKLCHLLQSLSSVNN